jgi:hypothetical protein
MSRGSSWMVRSVTATLAAVVSLTGLAGPAEAFDSNTCNTTFGPGNVRSVRQFTMDTGTLGKVDFGDHLHLFGAPQGTAVVCWHKDGPVAVRGYVFADSSEHIVFSWRIRYFRRDAVVATDNGGSFLGANAAAAPVNRTRTNAGITKIRIELLRGTANGLVVVPGGSKDVTA